MPYFPMFVNLREKTVLVVGGGSVARRKVEKLLPFGPKIRIVSPRIDPDLARLSEVAVTQRDFRAEDLLPRPAMVIAATDDREVNHRVFRLCREREIPVNVADDPDACTFLFPALVHQGEFCAGISTGGASPTAAIYFKERFQGMLPENLDDLLSWLEEQRLTLKRTVPEQARRAGIFRRMFDECLERGRPLTQEERENCLNGFSGGNVSIVDAGGERAGEITVEGLRLVQRCQAVVYDGSVDPALLEAAPESAERIALSLDEEEADQKLGERLTTLAQSGLRVVWLRNDGGPVPAAVREALQRGRISWQSVPETGETDGRLLSDIRIGITGTAEIARKQRRAFAALGAQTHWISRANVKERDLSWFWDEAAQSAGWLVFTSANGARIFGEAMKRGNVSPRTLSGWNLAAIGPATAGMLERNGLRASLVPRVYTGRELALSLAQQAGRGEPIWLLRSAIGTKTLPDLLKERGFAVREIPLYDLEESRTPQALPELNYLTFSSASGVDRFFGTYGGVPEGVRCVCIGSVTAQALERRTDAPFLLGDDISVSGMVKAIVRDSL